MPVLADLLVGDFFMMRRIQLGLRVRAEATLRQRELARAA